MRETLGEKLIEEIKREILFGNMLPGRKLTSQRQLAEKYNLSRATVREAVLQLELEGLIETRQGTASVCRNLLEPHFNLPFEGLGDNLDFQLQVMEMRAAIEGEAAYFAAQRASEKELEQLDQEFRRMQQRSAGETTLSKAKADLTFHMMIAESSHNLLLVSFSQIFYSRYFNAIYGVLTRTLKKFGRYPDGISQQHAQIHQALMNRNAEAARNAAREHIDYTRRQLEDAE